MPSSGIAESCGRKKCKEREREIERGRRESVERKDEEKKRGSIAVERELSGLPGFINVMEICIPG